MDRFKKKLMANNDSINTVIGLESELKGDLAVDGGIRIDGKLEGELSATGRLTIGKNGSVKANLIKCVSAVIGGKVASDLEANELVKLESGAVFHGNIKTKILIIEQGAMFNGFSKMTEKNKGDII